MLVGRMDQNQRKGKGFDHINWIILYLKVWKLPVRKFMGWLGENPARNCFSWQYWSETKRDIRFVSLFNEHETIVSPLYRRKYRPNQRDKLTKICRFRKEHLSGCFARENWTRIERRLSENKAWYCAPDEVLICLSQARHLSRCFTSKNWARRNVTRRVH